MRLRRFAFLGLFVSSVLAQQKIHPALQQIADPDARLRVLIMLRDQPQREVAARVSEAASAYIDSTDTEYRRLANEPFAFLPSLEAARTRRDLAVIETRREILRQIDSLIGPAQRNLMSRLTSKDLQKLAVDRNVPEALRISARKKVVQGASGEQ